MRSQREGMRSHPFRNRKDETEMTEPQTTTAATPAPTEEPLDLESQRALVFGALVKNAALVAEALAEQTNQIRALRIVLRGLLSSLGANSPDDSLPELMNAATALAQRRTLTDAGGTVQ
jgi:hypothetical protein